MIVVSVCCPSCHSDQMVQRGKTHRGTQRSLCHHTACHPQRFVLAHRYWGQWPEVV